MARRVSCATSRHFGRVVARRSGRGWRDDLAVGGQTSCRVMTRRIAGLRLDVLAVLWPDNLAIVARRFDRAGVSRDSLL